MPVNNSPTKERIIADGLGDTIMGRLSRIGFFIIRMLILFGMAKYLLRSELIPSILGIILFVVIFWLVILRVKVFNHDWIWPTRN